MQVSGTGNSVRGFAAYARAAATERLEAAAAAQRSRSASQGFRFGKLGVRYETEEPVEPDAFFDDARSAARSSVPAHDLDLAALRRQVPAASQLESAGDAQWMRRMGASAYQRADLAATVKVPSMIDMAV